MGAPFTSSWSFMAFGKLQELVKGAPITYRFQNPINISLFFVTLGMFAYLIVQPANQHVFYAMVGLGLLIGVFIVMPIGGADMPVVISLLNPLPGSPRLRPASCSATTLSSSPWRWMGRTGSCAHGL